MITLAELTSALGAENFGFLEHLEFNLEIPVIAGLQAQGDLFIVPLENAHGLKQEAVAVPAKGIAVIEAIGGGHEHRLFAGTPGTARFTPLSAGQDIGVLECTSPAYVLHPEHGASGIAPGIYTLRRQREQADKERIVAD